MNIGLREGKGWKEGGGEVGEWSTYSATSILETKNEGAMGLDG